MSRDSQEPINNRTSVAALASAAQAETAHFIGGRLSNQGPALELMRRAIIGGDQLSHVALVQLFTPHMQRWLAGIVLPAWLDREDVVQEAWLRIFRSFDAAKLAGCRDLPAAITYLRRCVDSARIDCLRAHYRDEPAWPAACLDADENGVEDEALAEVIDRCDYAGLWPLVQARTHGDAERLALELKYHEDLTAVEIAQRFPHLFPAPASVYQVQRRVCERLRRCPVVRRYHEGTPDDPLTPGRPLPIPARVSGAAPSDLPARGRHGSASAHRRVVVARDSRPHRRLSHRQEVAP